MSNYANALISQSKFPADCGTIVSLEGLRGEYHRNLWLIPSFMMILKEKAPDRFEIVNKILTKYNEEYNLFAQEMESYFQLCQKISSGSANSTEQGKWKNLGFTFDSELKNKVETLWPIKENMDQLVEMADKYFSENPSPSRLSILTENCDFKGIDKFSEMRVKVSNNPLAFTQSSCGVVKQYALAISGFQPQPSQCKDFEILFEGEKDFYLKSWAYLDFVSQRAESDPEQAEDIRKLLTKYLIQFQQYFAKNIEHAKLCERVHRNSGTPRDVQMWTVSGSILKQSVKSGIGAIWDKDGIKSTIDSSADDLM